MVADTKTIVNIFLQISKVEIDTSLVFDFVNAFFYKPDEFSKWIDKVGDKYKPSFITNLIKTGLSSKISSKDSKELFAKAEKLNGPFSFL